MGLFKKSCYTSPANPAAAQPNPDNWRLIRRTYAGKLVVCEVVYPNCTNYEGRKILLLRADPSKLTTLDPHFVPGGIVLARFEPTAFGWDCALALADHLRAHPES